MSIDPVARYMLLELTAHIRKKAERLLGEVPPPSDEAAAPEAYPPDEERVAATTGDEPPPLVRLQNAFALSSLEYGVVLTLLAAEVEPLFRTVIRALQREGGRPWLELGTIAEILELDRRSLPTLFEALLPHGKLRGGGLALVDEQFDGGESPMIHLRVKATRRLLRYCLGNTELPDGMSLVKQPRGVLAETFLAESTRDELVARVRQSLLYSSALVIDLTGVPGGGKKFLAEGIAAEIGRPLLVVDVRRWERRSASALALHLADVTREVVLANALPYLDWWETLVDDGLDGPPPPPSMDPDDAPPSAAPQRPLPPLFAQYLDHSPMPVFLGARQRFPQLDRLRAPIVHVGVPFPGPVQRGQLWQRTIERAGARLEEGIEPDEIGRKFALDPGRIVAATRSAVELALARDLAPDALEPPTERPQVTLSRDDLYTASRQQLQHELASLAVRMTKAHKWTDMVIPADVFYSLKELLSFVRHAADVYEKQGFGARHSIQPGLSALFAGPPGTGKTMCASVIARELEMELFRVDLSRVVSKWIGETEKNLGKVFDEAQRSHAVILFDEADSLFAKRTEVKSSIDRYANLEVAYLLQRMEQFSGITVLTTNFEDTIDPAFKRRITFKMRFERPDAEARANLWSKMFPAEARMGPDVDFDEVGRRFELSGGSIRNAVIRAAFLAADAGTPILQEHILTAAAREAREMGALVPDPGRPAAPVEEPAEKARPERDEEEPGVPRLPPRAVPITHPRR